MRVIEIAKIIDSWMPTSIAEDFDNVGLIIGDPESKITSILITLDTTEDVGIPEILVHLAELKLQCRDTQQYFCLLLLLR